MELLSEKRKQVIHDIGNKGIPNACAAVRKTV